MNDLGHAMLNTSNFERYEQFYVWDIIEEQNEDDSDDW
jgi:hypothetical protein